MARNAILMDRVAMRRALLLVLLAGCGSGAITQAAFPDAFAQAVCQVQAQCRRDAKYVEQQCEDDAKSLYGADLDKALKAGRATFDAQQAQACLDGLRARGCANNTPDVVACKQAVKGTLAVGASCDWLYECAKGLCTPDVGGSCPAKCANVGGAGAPCDNGCDERQGLRCIDNVCSKLHEADDKCSSDDDCDAGLFCDGFGKCSTRGFQQASCDGDDQCAAGLWCNRSPEGGLCSPQIATGKSCTASSAEAIAFACVDGDLCKGFSFAKTGATAGTCAPAGEVGASCVATAQITGCGNGLACVNGTCAEKPVSGPCTQTGDCKEGFAYCDGAQCQALKSDGAACGSNEECASRNCDASSGQCVEVEALCHEP